MIPCRFSASATRASEELKDANAAQSPNLEPHQVCDHRSAEGDEDRRAEAQLTSVCERARGYNERCGGKWYPELLRQHRGEKQWMQCMQCEIFSGNLVLVDLKRVSEGRALP